MHVYCAAGPLLDIAAIGANQGLATAAVLVVLEAADGMQPPVVSMIWSVVFRTLTA